MDQDIVNGPHILFNDGKCLTKYIKESLFLHFLASLKVCDYFFLIKYYWNVYC